jgi:hypothetical protein
MRSALFDALKPSYVDHYCVTCVRDLPEEEVLSRLGMADAAKGPLCTPRGAVECFPPELPAVRVCRNGRWTFLIDVMPHGRTFDVLSDLSKGTEVVAVWQLIAAGTKAAHARDGRLLGTFDSWHFGPAEGEDPSRLNGALAGVGFFAEGAWESEDFEGWVMVPAALEREFGLDLPAELVSGPLLTVRLPEL